MTVRVFWIIDDQRSAQAITVLSLVVAVIPICSLKVTGKTSYRERMG